MFLCAWKCVWLSRNWIMGSCLHVCECECTQMCLDTFLIEWVHACVSSVWVNAGVRQSLFAIAECQSEFSRETELTEWICQCKNRVVRVAYGLWSSYFSRQSKHPVVVWSTRLTVLAFSVCQNPKEVGSNAREDTNFSESEERERTCLVCRLHTRGCGPDLHLPTSDNPIKKNSSQLY